MCEAKSLPREDGSTDSPTISRASSNANLTNAPNAGRKSQSLQERSQIPIGFYGIALVLGCAHYAGNIWSMKTVYGWCDDMTSALFAYKGSFEYLRDLMHAAVSGEITDWKEFSFAIFISLMIASIFYVLVGAPLMAGFWTGHRATRHLVHRYMGLLFLTQYAAAWINYVTDYDKSINSILPHMIGINGIIQGMSAYFSFRVLPELEDPGYYSDKAVVSRSFVHENVFFSALTTLGSVYYNDEFRTSLRTCIPGHLVELMFVFFPYITLRPLFPTTSFSDAGKNKKGRTDENTFFYKVGTKMIKYFYLWAKYFLGFYINFLVYLGKLTDSEWHTLRGMYLLNVGTISIAIFLHTLRFKKVLPPKLTFSVYLLQIYGTFYAVPVAYTLFTTHRALFAMCGLGVVSNMARSRPIHGAWCLLAYYMINRTDIDW